MVRFRRDPCSLVSEGYGYPHCAGDPNDSVSICDPFEDQLERNQRRSMNGLAPAPSDPLRS